MRITVQVSVDTQDHTEPVVCEVFTLKREALAVDLVGFHLAEAHELVTALQALSGRVLFNGWPTGVAVTPAMQHGGPFPATTNPVTTSVAFWARRVLTSLA